MTFAEVDDLDRRIDLPALRQAYTEEVGADGLALTTALWSSAAPSRWFGCTMQPIGVYCAQRCRIEI
jgi:hypothetical protein